MPQLFWVRQGSSPREFPGPQVHVAVAVTRRELPAILAERDCQPGELVVSELVANAVCHGETPIWMRLSVSGGGLRVEVHDGGAGRPVRRHAGGGDECGRGLELLDGRIELYVGERGVISDPSGPGKTVYVVLSLAGAR